jgi:hypothetical protein
MRILLSQQLVNICKKFTQTDSTKHNVNNKKYKNLYVCMVCSNFRRLQDS